MLIQTLQGDCREVLKTLPDNSVNCCVTSPPYYGLRDYGAAGQIGLENTAGEYVRALVEVFKEVKRVLRSDGTLWLNLGDTYSRAGLGGNPAESAFRKQATNVGSLLPNRRNESGFKPKNLLGIPWRVAFALQDSGWNLRSEIIWYKPNAMPESVTDRPTKSHEQIFLLTKSSKYYYDFEAIKEPVSENTDWAYSTPDKAARAGITTNGTGKTTLRVCSEDGLRNKRSVWVIATQNYSGSHFATFPEKLIEPCILAGCPIGGTVLDPFGGSGTTGRVAVKHGRNAILIELNSSYLELINERTDKVQVRMAL